MRVRVVLAATALAALLATGVYLPSTASAHGIIDQQHDGTGSYPTIDFFEPIGQEFTPALTPMVAADVELTTANAAGDANITLWVRDATIDGAILGEVTQLVPEGPTSPAVEVFVHFDLPTPITLTPGQTYVLEIETDNVTHAWASGGIDDYPGGEKIVNGNVTPTGDFSFRTYYQATTSTPTASPPTTATPSPTPTPAPTPTATPAPGTTSVATPTPSAAAGGAGPSELPATGARPTDGGSDSLASVLIGGTALLVAGAGGLWLARERRRVR